MKKSFIKNLATCFGLGDMPKAPGTFGTLGGIPIYIGMLFLRKVFPNHMLYNSFYFMFLMTFFVVAVYVSDIAEREIYHTPTGASVTCGLPPPSSRGKRLPPTCAALSFRPPRRLCSRL